MIAAMAARSPARFLAPLALLAFVLALFLVVTRAPSGGDGAAGTAGQKPAVTPTTSRKEKPAARRTHAKRYYVVRPGDTPSGIAEKTGVPLATIERLNPDLDPQTLAPGTRLKLRP